MATGNVAIRFSAENYETVRRALEGLGKDGQKALNAIDAASKKPSGGLLSLSSLVEDMKGRMTGLAVSVGPLGTALVQLGPVGLAVAAAVGGVATVFSTLSERAEAFAERARELKEASETAGVTISQMKMLERAGYQVGLASEQTSAFMDRLTLSVEELKRGGGPLFDALLRIDEGLLRQVASAKNTAEAFDVLASAYRRLNDQGQRNALAKAIGGRSGVGAGQLLDYVSERGGMKALEEGAKQSGKEIDESLVKRLVALRLEIQRLESRGNNIMNVVFSEAVLQQQKRSAEFWLKIAEAAERYFKAASSGTPKNLEDATPRSGGVFPIGGVGLLRFLPNFRKDEPPADSAGVNWSTMGKGLQGITPPNAPAAESWSATVNTAATDFAIMQRWTSALGDAITPAEALRLKILELQAAQNLGSRADEVRTRALAAFQDAQRKVEVSTRSQIGIVTEQEMLVQRMIELDDLQAKGFIRNAEERAAAERLVHKEVREATEAQAVRMSSTPQLTKLAIDANKLTENLDEGLASALRGTTTTMLEMAKGTKTLGDGFADLATKIAEAVFQAMWMKQVVGPTATGISGGISSLFGDGGWSAGTTVVPSALGNIFSGGRLMAFAKGGVVHRPTLFAMANGAGLMGEAGPEAIMPLRRMNGGRLGISAEGMGAPQVNIQIVNNHSGAKVEAREENDGRGGRRTVVVIDEMVANSAGRPGSKTKRAMQMSDFRVRR